MGSQYGIFRKVAEILTWQLRAPRLSVLRHKVEASKILSPKLDLASLPLYSIGRTS